MRLVRAITSRRLVRNVELVRASLGHGCAFLPVYWHSSAFAWLERGAGIFRVYCLLAAASLLILHCRAIESPSANRIGLP